MFRRLLSSSLLRVCTSLSVPVMATGENIALQMYSLRNVGSLEEQFAMAHRAGFKYVEVVETPDVSAEQLKRTLQHNGLTAISAHVQLIYLEKNYEQVVKYNQVVGISTIVVPWIEPQDRPDSFQAWVQYAKRLDVMGERLRQSGMQLAYHNHNFEMKKYEGITALEIILNHSSSQNLKLEMDAAWVSRGGQDPLRFINAYPQRIFALHAKDNAPIGVRDDEMNFAPVGEGLLDWPSILPAAQKNGVKWLIIEHDKPKDAWSVITTSLKNLQHALAKIN